MTGKKKLKIALVCSDGGHLTEMQLLWPAFIEYDCFLVTYRSKQTEQLSLVQRKYLQSNIGTNVFHMIRAFLQAFFILLRERPDIVLSIGAEIAIPYLWVGKFLGAKTVYIESWCRTGTRSATAKFVYPMVELFLVQWRSLLKTYGPKARYWGGLI